MGAALFLLAAAAVPDVTAGPDLAEQARLVETPIAHVAVFSDRARVRRRARVDLKSGVQSLRLSDLPGAAMLDTVRVSCAGARVLRVEATPVERERFSIEQVEELIEKLEAVADKIAAVDREIQVQNEELGFLGQISPVPPVEEAERVGKPLPPVQPDRWRGVLDFLDQRAERARARVRELSLERRELNEEMTRVQAEIGRHDLGAFTDHKLQVVAILSADKSGQARLELEYFVPGAYWLPAYDLYFDPDAGKMAIHSAGMVSQATGEDWTEVELSLSTAIPGQGIGFPELLTWTLGEKKEFIPRSRAARRPAQAARFAPPSAQPRAAESDRAARLQVLQERLNRLNQLVAIDVSRTQLLGDAVLAGTISGGGYGGLGASGRGRGGGGAAYHAGRARPRPSRPAPPPPPPRSYPGAAARSAPMAPPAEADMLAEEAPMGGVSDSTSSRRSGRSRESVRRTSLGLLDRVSYRPPSFSNTNLPAVVAGGLDYVYDCPTRATIPSTGQQLRVPLAAEEYPTVTFYEATPSLMKTAFLKATVKNKGERPILRGPASIFMGRDFVGQGQLQTTGAGGEIPLPLGADEDIRLLRKVVTKTETKGVIKKDEVTSYTVTLEVGNYKKRPVRIRLYDQVPKSHNEDIEIELRKVTPAQSEGPNKDDGVLTWDLKLPPGQTRIIEFRYKIKRPENWKLYQ